MDICGNRTDEHDSCDGEILHNVKYDSLYCTGCGEWVEGVCGCDDCGFCKGRPVRPEV